jgi:hypothetical protein
MQNTKRNIILMGVILSILMAIFPPWVYVDDSKVAHPMGYAPIWKAPVIRHDQSAEVFGIKFQLSAQTETANSIDIFRLMLQIAILCAVTGGAAVLLKRSPA